MIKMVKQKSLPYGSKTARLPLLTKEEIKSRPVFESSSQMIEAVISEYPLMALIGGFAFGGLLGWLIKR